MGGNELLESTVILLGVLQDTLKILVLPQGTIIPLGMLESTIILLGVPGGTIKIPAFWKLTLTAQRCPAALPRYRRSVQSPSVRVSTLWL